MVHEWTEDEFFGRYEVALKVDFGTTVAATAALAKLLDIIPELDALGFELDVRNVIYAQHGRKT